MRRKSYSIRRIKLNANNLIHFISEKGNTFTAYQSVRTGYQNYIHLIKYRFEELFIFIYPGENIRYDGSYILLRQPAGQVVYLCIVRNIPDITMNKPYPLFFKPADV